MKVEYLSCKNDDVFRDDSEVGKHKNHLRIFSVDGRTDVSKVLRFNGLYIIIHKDSNGNLREEDDFLIKALIEKAEREEEPVAKCDHKIPGETIEKDFTKEEVRELLKRLL